MYHLEHLEHLDTHYARMYARPCAYMRAFAIYALYGQGDTVLGYLVGSISYDTRSIAL